MKKFSAKANARLVANQHKLDRILRKLAIKNGQAVYRNDRDRAEKVIQHYLRKYHIIGTSVQHFWHVTGTGRLIGRTGMCQLEFTRKKVLQKLHKTSKSAPNFASNVKQNRAKFRRKKRRKRG